MNKYVKAFLHRGLLFGGFGPMVMGIIFCVISLTDGITFSGGEVLLGIISTYLLAFVHAGASVFNSIEEWSIARSLGAHLGVLYLAYLICYLINSWITFMWEVIAIFTIVFLVCYFVVWGIVYLITRRTSRRLTESLK